MPTRDKGESLSRRTKVTQSQPKRWCRTFGGWIDPGFECIVKEPHDCYGQETAHGGLGDGELPDYPENIVVEFNDLEEMWEVRLGGDDTFETEAIAVQAAREYGQSALVEQLRARVSELERAGTTPVVDMRSAIADWVMADSTFDEFIRERGDRSVEQWISDKIRVFELPR